MPTTTNQPKPKPRKIDYQIRVEQGTFAPDDDFFRVYVSDELGKRQRNFNAVKVNEGFGSTKTDAIKDFIQRNTSDVLNEVFDL